MLEFDHLRMASRGGFNMSVHRADIKLSVTLALTSVTLFSTSAIGQSRRQDPISTDKTTVAPFVPDRQRGKQSRG